MSKTLIALALAALAVPFAASASESNGIGYNYVQADYIYNDLNAGLGQPSHTSGFGLSGSWSFTDNFFMTGGFSQVKGTSNLYIASESTKYKVRNNIQNWKLGVGFNTAIGNRADWVSQLAYNRGHGSAKVGLYEFTECGQDACLYDKEAGHGNSVTISTGVLGKITDNLSANAYLGYDMTTRHLADNTIYGDFGLLYNFTPTWGVRGGVVVGRDSTSYSAGVRASF